MSRRMSNVLRIYLDTAELARAVAGDFHIMNVARRAFERRGYSVVFVRNSRFARAMSALLPGYSLFLMDHPWHPRALTLRLAYFYPFWRIERTAQRWDWSIAHRRFDPAKVDHEKADQFTRWMRHKHFPGLPEQSAGYVYIPLQGKLLRRRKFQSQSPIDMIRTALAMDQSRPIVASLHPKELYSSADMAALQALSAQEPRFSVSDAPMLGLVTACDYVVTQNSSVALTGFFFQKPAVLFAEIEFHHIACSVPRLGAEAAFAGVRNMEPAFNRYLYWFFKGTAIDAGSGDAEKQIADTVTTHGWRLTQAVTT